eukprot:353522-Chlamydomonas_euryale.AAC.2
MPMVISPARRRWAHSVATWRASGTTSDGSTPDLASSPLVLTCTMTASGSRPAACTCVLSLSASFINAGMEIRGQQGGT